MKLEIIADWRAKLRAASVWVGTAWGALLAALSVNPYFITNAIPEEIKSLLPGWLRFVLMIVAVFGTIYAARIVKQPSVSGER